MKTENEKTVRVREGAELLRLLVRVRNAEALLLRHRDALEAECLGRQPSAALYAIYEHFANFPDPISLREADAAWELARTLPLPAASTVEAEVVGEVREGCEGCEECGDTGLSLNDEGRCGHCEMAEREQRDMDLDREDS